MPRGRVGCGTVESEWRNQDGSPVGDRERRTESGRCRKLYSAVVPREKEVSGGVDPFVSPLVDNIPSSDAGSNQASCHLFG